MSDSKKRDSDWASARARVRAHTLTRRGKGARDGEEGREKEGGREGGREGDRDLGINSKSEGQSFCLSE